MLLLQRQRKQEGGQAIIFLTCIQWVFNTHQRRPVAIVHFFNDVILRNVGPTILDANASAHVVEGAPVQLKELNQ